MDPVESARSGGRETRLLLVTIAIERHPFFRREGDDVRMDLPITLDEAVAGAEPDREPDAPQRAGQRGATYSSSRHTSRLR